METDVKLPAHSQQLQIESIQNPEPTGLIEEFHVVIVKASVPGRLVSASCHAMNIRAVEAHDILWQLARLINSEA